MQITRKVAPGQKGARKLLAQYGCRLVYVRCRYDKQERRRFKPIELVIEESPWTPQPPNPETVVGVHVAFK